MEIFQNRRVDSKKDVLRVQGLDFLSLEIKFERPDFSTKDFLSKWQGVPWKAGLEPARPQLDRPESDRPT